MTTDASASVAFTMYGAREAMAAGLHQIEEQIKGVEQAVTGNTGLAFDLCTTLVESACKTILRERAITFSNNDDVQTLFRIATQQLPFLPPSAASDAEAGRSLRQTISGLQTALQGVCELRNSHGFASHGRDRQGPAMEEAQAFLVGQAADAIVGFLYRVHKQERPVASRVRLAYDQNPGFNEYADLVNDPVHIFDLEYRPSEVLFSVDQEGYRDALAGFSVEGDDEMEDAAVEESD